MKKVARSALASRGQPWLALNSPVSDAGEEHVAADIHSS